MEKKQKAVALWEGQKLAEVKKQYGSGLTDAQWNLFVGIGEATGLNPFLREIWCVKYGGKASIFIGRDGYRKVAQKNPDYDYHFVDAVYDNDDFQVNSADVTVTHKKAKGERGKLAGAYCLVKRKKSSRPNYIFVDYLEYKGAPKSLWGSKPATMIKKVAEAQCLRMTFQELFAGTYEESEDFTEPPVVRVVKKKPNLNIEINRFNTVFSEFVKLRGLTNKRAEKGLETLLSKKYNARKLKDLTEAQIDNAIKLISDAVKKEKAKAEDIKPENSPDEFGDKDECEGMYVMLKSKWKEFAALAKWDSETLKTEFMNATGGEKLIKKGIVALKDSLKAIDLMIDAEKSSMEDKKKKPTAKEEKKSKKI